MKNSTKLAILTFFLGFVYSNAQFLQVIYEMKFRPSTQDTIHKKEMMVLSINEVNKKSVFKSYGALQIDSINLALQQQRTSGQQKVFTEKIDFSTLQDSSFQFLIQKNSVENTNHIVEEINYQKYQAPYHFPSTQWELLEEQKQIQGYLCKKAKINFGGRVWNAFFATEIPISDGPYKFYGLPGLIVMLYSDDGDYSFTLRSLLQKKEGISVDFDAIKVSPTQLSKAKSTYINDPAMQLKGLKIDPNTISTAVYNGEETSSTLESTIKYTKERVKKWRETHDNYIEKGEIWLN